MAACILFFYSVSMWHNGTWPSLEKWNHFALAESKGWRDYDGWNCLKRHFAKALSKRGESYGAIVFDDAVVCPTSYPRDLRPHLTEAIKRNAVFVRRIVAEVQRDGIAK